MFSGEVRTLIFQVITSWQVWAVTIVLVLYIFIVRNVARIHHRSANRQPLIPKVKPEKAETPASSAKDDLGLDEDSKDE